MVGDFAATPLQDDLEIFLLKFAGLSVSNTSTPELPGTGHVSVHKTASGWNEDMGTWLVHIVSELSSSFRRRHLPARISIRKTQSQTMQPCQGWGGEGRDGQPRTLGRTRLLQIQLLYASMYIFSRLPLLPPPRFSQRPVRKAQNDCACGHEWSAWCSEPDHQYVASA